MLQENLKFDSVLLSLAIAQVNVAKSQFQLKSSGKVLTLSQNKYVITILNQADNCVASFFDNDLQKCRMMWTVQ